MKPIRLTTYTLIILFYSNFNYAQITKPNKQKDFEYAVTHSDYVIEGHILNSRGYNIKTGIYTSDSIKITKVFKGDITDSLIEVVFEGGSADGIETFIFDGNPAIAGDGIYFIKKNTSNVKLRSNMQSYTTTFGSGNSISYFLVGPHRAIWEGIAYDDIEKDIFQSIEAITGQKRKILAKNMFGF